MTGPRLTGNRCQCPTCSEYFGSVRGFDRHRIGIVAAPDRRCLTVAELSAAGWQRSARGFLLMPDARRAGAGVEAASMIPPITGATAAKDTESDAAPACCEASDEAA